MLKRVGLPTWTAPGRDLEGLVSSRRGSEPVCWPGKLAGDKERMIGHGAAMNDLLPNNHKAIATEACSNDCPPSAFKLIPCTALKHEETCR
jgi:hypothetical protein